MMLRRDTIAEIFALLPFAKVTIGTSLITKYHITDRVLITYNSGMIPNRSAVYLEVDEMGVDIPEDDRQAFLKWLKEHNGLRREAEIYKIEEGIWDEFTDLTLMQTADSPKIEDYV